MDAAVATWRSVGLNELQQQLDSQGTSIVERQKESVLERKGLADQTKEFRKFSDEQKLGELKSLLKSYQNYVESLTNRAKEAENSFLNIYKALAEVPDPYPLLSTALEEAAKAAQNRELESELQSLKVDNGGLRRRVDELSATESAKQRLEQRVDELESKMDEAIDSKVTQKEKELHATYDEKLRNYEEREVDAQRQLEVTKQHLRDLRMSNETTQAKLLDHTQRQDEEVLAKLAELELVATDLDRANSRVVAVERRNEMLRAEIESVRSGNDADGRIRGLEAQKADLESETDRLSRVLQEQQRTKLDAAKTSDRTLHELQRSLDDRMTEIADLKKTLAQYNDYDEVKRELSIMKFVEFGDSDEASLPEANPRKANQKRELPLEALLSAKNKRIQEELAKFRVMHAELEASLRSVRQDLKTSQDDLEQQRTLNEQLETDLLQLNSASADRPTGQSTPLNNGLVGLGVGGLESPETKESSTRSSPIPFKSTTETSILPIVTSQRDRFRQRNAELEDELRKQFQSISELRAEIRGLQADNLKLYEKVRYMQSYRDDVGPQSASRSSASNSDPRLDSELSKYKARYEQSMNPFEAFRGREANIAVQALNPLERGVLIITRHILGNRRTRLTFVVYAISLHLLVLFTMYECTTSGTRLKTQPNPY